MSKRALGAHPRCVVTVNRRVTGACIAVSAWFALFLVAASGAQSPDQALERQRLRLDVERLQRDSGWQSDVQRWLPAASVLVALAVAAYGVWRYFDERRRALDVRAEEGVGHNLDRLVDRPAGETRPNARAIVALRNLNALAPATARPLAVKHRSEITEAVTALVRDDVATFLTADDARFPLICVDHWAELKRSVQEDPELCFLVLRRYLDALQRVATRAPAYVRNVKKEHGCYLQDAPIEVDDARLFAAVVAGFERFVSLAPPGELREEAIRDFSDKAKVLGRQLFSSRPDATR